MVDFWRKKVNSKKNFLSWVFTFYKKNLVEKIYTVAAHLRATAINPKSDLFTRQFTK